MCDINRFKNMSDAEWGQVISVHVKGAFACTKAAWPHFRNQKFGRIVNISSAAGIYGMYMGQNFRNCSHMMSLQPLRPFPN